MQRLTHRNIIRMWSQCQRKNGKFDCLVMDYADQGTLDVRQKRKWEGVKKVFGTSPRWQTSGRWGVGAGSRAGEPTAHGRANPHPTPRPRGLHTPPPLWSNRIASSLAQKLRFWRVQASSS
jgi:hypothetical protein